MFGFLRKRVLKALSNVLFVLRSVLVSHDGRYYRRYRLTQNGWIYTIVPRLQLELVGEYDIKKLAEQASFPTNDQLLTLSRGAQQEATETIRRSAAVRAGQAELATKDKMHEIMLKTERGPSELILQGRGAIQLAYRSMVENASKIAVTRFSEMLKRNLAQIIAYARLEVGGSTPQTTALPHGTRFYFPGDPLCLYVIEEPPRVRTIIWDHKSYQLAFPYVVHCIYLKNGKYELHQVFFRNETLKTITDPLGLPPLPNLMANLNGSTGPLKEYYTCAPVPNLKKDSSPSEIITAVIQSFWDSSFIVHDGRVNHWPETHRSIINRMPDFQTNQWSDQTKTDPLFVLKVNWVKVKYTIQDFASQLKTPTDAFDAVGSLTQLTRFAETLRERLQTTIQEALIEHLEDAKGLTRARELFDQETNKSEVIAHISKRAREAVEAELLAACESAKVELILEGVNVRAATEFRKSLEAARNRLVESLTETLQNPDVPTNNGAST